MKQLKSVYRLIAKPRGQTMAEYALILATIAAISVALVQSAGVILDTIVNTVVHLFGH
jgi:Flp pilus assembly pilin Flp